MPNGDRSVATVPSRPGVVEREVAVEPRLVRGLAVGGRGPRRTPAATGTRRRPRSTRGRRRPRRRRPGGRGDGTAGRCSWGQAFHSDYRVLPWVHAVSGCCCCSPWLGGAAGWAYAEQPRRARRSRRAAPAPLAAADPALPYTPPEVTKPDADLPPLAQGFATHDERLGVPGEGGVVLPVPDGWGRTTLRDGRGPLDAARRGDRRRLLRPGPGRRPAALAGPGGGRARGGPRLRHPAHRPRDPGRAGRHAAGVLHPRRLAQAAGDPLGELRRQRDRPRDLGDRPADRRAGPRGAGVEDRDRGVPAGAGRAARGACPARRTHLAQL